MNNSFTGNYVLVMGTDVDGILRGKIIPKSKVTKSPSTTQVDMGFCGVIFEWDSMDVVYSSTAYNRKVSAITGDGLLKGGGICKDSTGNSQGYPDIIARVDLNSFRCISLAPRHSLGDLAIMFMDFLDKKKQPLAFCPRSVLKSILKELLEHSSMYLNSGFELEWYTYKGRGMDTVQGNCGPHDMAISQGMFGYSMLRPWCNSEYMSQVLQSCLNSSLEIDCFHTETGPGVYEVALKFKPALTAADECQLFKYLVKTTAYRHNMTASFMAKPWNDLPGCGGHIHLSLCDSTGKNLFSQVEQEEENGGGGGYGGGLPTIMKPFIAGILECLPDLMPFVAPNVNSYKRLDVRYWAPVIVGWGFDNRLAVVRVIISDDEPNSNRIEIRVPGADMNPYYALAAILAAGLYGIKNSLSLSPPLDASLFNVGADLPSIMEAKGYKSLPSTLAEATARMISPTSKARKLFPSLLIDHFGMTRIHELKSFEAYVTDWERKRYLEST